MLDAMGPDIGIASDEQQRGADRLSARYPNLTPAARDLLKRAFGEVEVRPSRESYGRSFSDLDRRSRRRWLRTTVGAVETRLLSDGEVLPRVAIPTASGSSAVPLYDPRRPSAYSDGSNVSAASGARPAPSMSSDALVLLAVGAAMFPFAPDPDEFPHMMCTPFRWGPP
jgi:hypothetical protein